MKPSSLQSFHCCGPLRQACLEDFSLIKPFIVLAVDFKVGSSNKFATDGLGNVVGLIDHLLASGYLTEHAASIGQLH